MEAYRVRKNFQWDGWIYAPQGGCKCGCDELDGSGCTGVVGTGCNCHDTCHCDCGIRANLYGGDVWFVDEGNPRKEMMLAHRFATYDSSLPPTDSLLEQDEYKKLLSTPPSIKPAGRKRAVAA